MIACLPSLFALSSLQFTQPCTVSILISSTSYSFSARNLSSLNTAVKGRRKIVKRTGSNILVQPFFYIYFIFSTDWGIFLNYAYLFILPKNSFQAVKAVVNFLSLMFQGTCCVFFILCKNRHGRIHQLLKSLGGLKLSICFLHCYSFIVLEFEQYLISLCFIFSFREKIHWYLFVDVERTLSNILDH